MSLITDKVFYAALTASETIVSATDGRIYNTSVPVPDAELDNEPTPYIVITFDGLQNEGWTKDNTFEGDTDRVTVSIDVVAETREELGTLTETIRSQVISFFEAYDPDGALAALIPAGYNLTASAIAYDSQKPCYYQTLQYLCDTNP